MRVSGVMFTMLVFKCLSSGMRTKYRILAIQLAFFVFHEHCLFAEDLRIERTLVIEDEFGRLYARTNLGLLKSEAKINATLELKNNSSVLIPIRKMETTCNCVRVRSEANNIPANGSISLEMSLDVPKDSMEATKTLLFSIFQDDEHSITVILKYSVAGLVSFKTAHTHLSSANLGAKVHDFRIPILVTAPVDVTKLQVIPSDSLLGLSSTVHQKDGEQWIECKIGLDSEKPISKVGHVTLKDPTSGRIADITLIIEAAASVSFAPTVLRFEPELTAEKDSRGTWYSARTIVRIDSSVLEFRKDDPKTEMPVDFEWKTKEGTVTHTQKRIAAGVYRVELRWRAGKFDKDGNELRPKSIVGRFSSGLMSASKESPVLFSYR